MRIPLLLAAVLVAPLTIGAQSAAPMRLTPDSSLARPLASCADSSSAQQGRDDSDCARTGSQWQAKVAGAAVVGVAAITAFTARPQSLFAQFVQFGIDGTAQRMASDASRNALLGSEGALFLPWVTGADVPQLLGSLSDAVLPTVDASSVLRFGEDAFLEIAGATPPGWAFFDAAHPGDKHGSPVPTPVSHGDDHGAPVPTPVSHGDDHEAQVPASVSHGDDHEAPVPTSVSHGDDHGTPTTSTPEPATLVLTAAGFASLAGIARRRRQRARGM
jgi:hypothetical protein